MMKARYGKIINIGSGTTTRGIPNMAHYVTSKGAVVAMTRTLSRELGEHGICINTLSPGFTLSETVLADNPHHVDMSRTGAVQRRALKRDMFPPDLLGALVFLSSSDSDFITGQTIAVDGGATNS
jgi:NAD(P)-dependent dehydrogenase (short-subunit alcohol dehydrogenase family)